MNEQKPKNHLRVHEDFWLIKNPKVEQAGELFGEALFEEIGDLPKDFLLAPVVFSPDKTIYFHGGDFLPHTHLPMPWAGDELWIGQYPETREVGFIPLYAFLMPDHLYQKMNVPDKFGDNIIDHAEFIMQAKKMGVKCFVTPNVHCVWPSAFNPEIGKEEFTKKVTEDLKKFEDKWAKELDREYNYPVVVHTIISQAGGYNMHAFNFMKALYKKRVMVYYHFIGGTNEDEPASECSFVDDAKMKYGSNQLPQITLCHGTNNFKNSGAYKIAFSTTEVDGIPDDWVKCFNEMDEVWATSHFAKKAFVDSGVTTPVHVIHEGVDKNYFHPGIAPFSNPPEEKFKFITNFAWGRRKGVDVLFEAFRKEFDDDEDVCLMLKALPSFHGHKIKDELKLVYEREGSAPVYVYDMELKKYEMGRFYKMGDCFVWPSRGEGFGLPPLEALSCGLPVIASNHSSHLEFLTKDGEPLPGVELIDGKLEPYEKGDSIYYHGFNWFQPSVKHFRKLMRKIYENREDYKKKAEKTSKYIHKNWNWETTQKKAVERIKNIYDKKWNI